MNASRPVSIACLTAVAAVGAAIAAPGVVFAQAPDKDELVSIDQLEEMAITILSEGTIDQGGKKVPIDPTIPAELKHLIPTIPKGLVFPSSNSTIEIEVEFLGKWIETYEKIIDTLTGTARGITKEKKILPSSWTKEENTGKFLQKFAKRYGPGSKAKPSGLKKTDDAGKEAFAEMWGMLPRMFLRYADLFQKKAMNPAQRKAMIEERLQRAKNYLKRYELGKDIAQPRVLGSSLVFVQLSPQVRGMAEDYLTGMSPVQIYKKDGNPLYLGSKKVLWLAASKVNPELKRVLEDLLGESFVGRYSVLEGDVVTDIMRVTGAKLLLGDFFFLEWDGHIAVVRRDQ